MASRIKTRLKTLEKATRASRPADEDERGRGERFLAECRAANAPLVEYVQATVDPDLWVPLLRAMAIAEGEPDVFGEWVPRPFAPWAEIPPDFRFPRELILTFTEPGDTLRMGHACERCGLRVPLYTFGDCGDVPAFPQCPRCGGRTTEAANHATGPVPTTEDVK